MTNKFIVSVTKVLKTLKPHQLSMKDDVVSLTSERIISIINDHRNKSKQGYIRLENVGGCKGSEMKLKLNMFYDGKKFGRIVSDCLSLDEIGKIRKVITRFCEQNRINMR